MNRAEAEAILAQQLATARTRSREELIALIAESEHEDVVSESGKSYQVERLALWDGTTGGDLRVMISIDDGGLRAFFPLTRSFLVAPDGSVASD